MQLKLLTHSCLKHLTENCRQDLLKKENGNEEGFYVVFRSPVIQKRMCQCR